MDIQAFRNSLAASQKFKVLLQNQERCSFTITSDENIIVWEGTVTNRQEIIAEFVAIKNRYERILENTEYSVFVRCKSSSKDFIWELSL